MLIRSHADRPPASSIVALTLVVALLAGGACGGDGPTGPGSARPLFRVVAGGEARDTIGAKLNQGLVVEIRDSAGAIAPGKTVRFEALRSTDPKRANESSVLLATLASTVYSTFTADAADSSGRAKTLIAFGTIVGRVFVRVTVPELGVVDTVGFSVLPGAPAKFVIAPRDTTVQPGANYSLNVSTTDRAANPVTVTPSYAAGAGLSVSSSGVVIAGTALARGQIVISAQSLRDTARVTVMPALRVTATRIANSTRTVTFVNADGTNTVNIGASYDFSLSPHAVAASPSGVFYQGNPGGGATIWIGTPGQTAAKTLVSSANGFGSATWPRLSPDAAWVYFTGWRSLPARATLWRIRADGSRLDSLGTFGTSAVITAPTVSPDGNTLAVDDDAGLKLMDVNTKASRTLPVVCGAPRYSPDGKRLACIKNGLVTVVNADGTNLRPIVPNTSLPSVNDLYGVDWSPDGQFLVVGASVPTLVSVADGSTIPLTALSAYTQVSFVR